MDHPHTEAANQQAAKREIISRHNTSEGVVVYARSEDGTLAMWLVPYDPSRPGLATRAA